MADRARLQESALNADYAVVMIAAPDSARTHVGAASNAAEAAYAERPLNPHRLDAVRRHVHDSFLDVGCGNGAYVRAVADRSRSAGLDHAPFADWAALPGRFAVGDATHLPFPDRSFETVSCFETLEHLADPGQALRELRRVADRAVLLTVPNCEVTEGQRASGLIYHHWIDRTHLNFWSFDDFVGFVRSDDWVIEEACRINSIDLRPLLEEAYSPAGLRAAVLRRLLSRCRRREYAMTTMVVLTRHRG